MDRVAAGNLEIERRFLVEAVPAEFQSAERVEVDQGYLGGEPAVRLRSIDDVRFFMTIKRGHGAVREEREVELTREQFSVFWPLTEGRRLHKIRRRIPWRAHLIELDSFSAPHDGLHIAEVEFSGESEMREFEPPGWFGKEVTGDSRYANIHLARS